MNPTVTQHAIERYQQRVRPELTFWQARMALKEALSKAHPVRQRSPEGDEMLELDGVQFVIRRDPGIRRPACITVLIRPTTLEDRMAADLLARYGT